MPTNKQIIQAMISVMEEKGAQFVKIDEGAVYYNIVEGTEIDNPEMLGRAKAGLIVMCGLTLKVKRIPAVYSADKLTDKLLPCPFCGGLPHDAVFFVGYLSAGNFGIKCIQCGVAMYQDRIDKVIGIWNNRAKQ